MALFSAPLAVFGVKAAPKPVRKHYSLGEFLVRERAYATARELNEQIARVQWAAPPLGYPRVGDTIHVRIKPAVLGR